MHWEEMSRYESRLDLLNLVYFHLRPTLGRENSEISACMESISLFECVSKYASEHVRTTVTTLEVILFIFRYMKAKTSCPMDQHTCERGSIAALSEASATSLGVVLDLVGNDGVFFSLSLPSSWLSL